MDEYLKKVIYYLNNPKFQKKLEKQTHTLELKSQVCGDPLRINLFVKDNIIKDISYTFNGCGLNVAVTEIFCEYLLDKEINKIVLFSFEEIKKELNFPVQKSHCVNLAFETFQEILKNFKNQNSL